MQTYWARTAVGLESLAADEFVQNNLGIIDSLGHRSVFLKSDIPLDLLRSRPFKLIDDIYLLVGVFDQVDHHRNCIAPMIARAATALEAQGNLLNENPIRITASFLGKRNYNRYFIEQQFNQLLEEKFDLEVLNNALGVKHVSGEQRLRIHLENDLAYMGVALKETPWHRRAWRTERYEGQLHPPIASAMVSNALLKSAWIIDPFCGSGTILIEAALAEADQTLGLDRNQAAIEAAETHAGKAEVDIDFRCQYFDGDLSSWPDYVMVSNPPWGKKYRENGLLKILGQALDHERKAILLMPNEFSEWLIEKGIKFSVKFTTRIRGQIVSAYQINH